MQTHNDPQSKGIIYENLGLLYSDAQNYELALDFFQKAEQHFEQHNQNKLFANNKAHMGLMYAKQNKFEKARLSYKQAIDYYKLAQLPEDIGKVLNWTGLLHKDQNQYAEAQAQYLQALTFAESNNLVANIWLNMGNLQLKQQQYDKAIGYYQKVLTLKNQVTEPLTLLATYNNYGEALQLQGKPNEANSLFENAYTIHQQNPTYHACNINTLKQLAQYALKARPALANRYYEELNQLQQQHIKLLETFHTQHKQLSLSMGETENQLWASQAATHRAVIYQWTVLVVCSLLLSALLTYTMFYRKHVSKTAGILYHRLTKP